MSQAYVPVRGKETRIAQLRRIANAYANGTLSSGAGHIVATNLHEVADRIARKVSDVKAVKEQ